jgi:hypothetical protein
MKSKLSIVLLAVLMLSTTGFGQDVASGVSKVAKETGRGTEQVAKGTARAAKASGRVATKGAKGVARGTKKAAKKTADAVK